MRPAPPSSSTARWWPRCEGDPVTTWTGTLPVWTVEEVTALDLDTMTKAIGGLTDSWSTWSPTTANLTLGNGTITARYRMSGKTGDFFFSFVLGSTSAIGT